MKTLINAIYNGKEYSARKINEKEVILISQDNKTLELGFEKKVLGKVVAYHKKVLIEQLQSLFKREEYAEYKGYSFSVEDENDDGEILIVSNFGNCDICKKLCMDRKDKFCYQKWIPKNEAVIIEKIENL